MKILQFSVRSFTGTDAVAAWLYSRAKMARRVAKKLMREGGPWTDFEPSDECRMLILMPDRAYRVVDAAGHVEPWDGEVKHVGV